MPVSLRSMVWRSEILSRRRRRETSYGRSPGAASPERMSSMVTPVEVSVASTSRCRRWRLPERRRVLSRPISTPAFVLLAGGGGGRVAERRRRRGGVRVLARAGEAGTRVVGGRTLENWGGNGGGG
jgi:hypothetical protein